MQSTTVAGFPFRIEDLKSWTIKRTDGTVTKFILSNSVTSSKNANTNDDDITALTLPGGAYSGYRKSNYNLAGYCSHTPGKEPLVTFTRPPDSPVDYLSLWVGNMGGAKITKDAFNFVIDCGDIFTLWQTKGQDTLSGDSQLAEALNPFTKQYSLTRVLKVDWDDRAAAPLHPQFWEELNKLIYGDVMTCCVGGHGRSGTAFVSLLLANAPDYDALDALVHCRAVHCPRAIESVAQHEYINEVAKYFGREENAKESSKIQNYKAAFLASKKPTAIRTREELKWLEK